MSVKTTTPLLDHLLKDGSVWLDGREYVGRATDGVEVSLGSLGDEEWIEKYLSANPTPDTW